MSGIAGAILGLSAIALCGLSLGRPLLIGLSRPERLGWSLALGLLVAASVLGLLYAVRPGSDPTLAVALSFAVLIAPLLRRGTRPTERAIARPLPLSARLLLLAAAAGVALFAVAAVSEPMWTTDYLAVWGLKAKTMFLTSSVPSRLFHDPETAWSHPEYPLLLPLDLAALSVWARGWDDRGPALLYPLCQAATDAAAFGLLFRRGLAVGGAAAAALVAAFFPLYAPAHVGMADIPLALGLALLASALLDAFDEDSGAVRGRLALAAFFCAAMKFEGSLFAGLAGLLWLAARPRGRARWPAAIALLAPPLVHRLLMFLMRGPAVARDFDFRLVAPSRWGLWFARLVGAVARIVQVEVLTAAVPLVLLALFFALTRRGLADRLLPLLFSQTLGYVVACSLSAFGVAWLVEASFARIACALFPALALVLGARVSQET